MHGLSGMNKKLNTSAAKFDRQGGLKKLITQTKTSPSDKQQIDADFKDLVHKDDGSVVSTEKKGPKK